MATVFSVQAIDTVQLTGAPTTLLHRIVVVAFGNRLLTALAQLCMS
jgi:hypothetical protein